MIKSLNSACIGLDAQGQNDCVVCAFGFYYSDVYYPLEKSLNEESKFGVEACINSEKYIGNPNISVFIGVPSNYRNNDNETGKGSLENPFTNIIEGIFILLLKNLKKK